MLQRNSRFFFFFLLQLLASVALANQPLEPFDVTYKLSRSGFHAANVTVSLAQQSDQWQWRTKIETASLLALFSNKRSYSHTTFTLRNGNPEISSIVIGEEDNAPVIESARFNWTDRYLDTQRKGQTSRFQLAEPVFDSQSIHLLAAQVYFSAQSASQASYYHKGALHKITMVYEGLRETEINGQLQKLEIFSLSREGNDTKVSYFYVPGEMLYPVKIIRSEPDESDIIMTLLEAQS